MTANGFLRLIISGLAPGLPAMGGRSPVSSDPS